MTTAGANPTGQKQDDIRSIFFGQDAVNTLWNGQNNPLGNIVTKYFPGAQQFSRARLSLGKLALFNSWFNITAMRGNNTFSYLFPENGTAVTHAIVVPDGSFETWEEIGEYLDTQMLALGDYLVYWDLATSTATIEYFINFNTSTYLYAYNATMTQLPAQITVGNPGSGSASGWYAPVVGWEGLPDGTPGSNVTAADQGLVPSLVIPATNAAAGSNTPGQYSFSKLSGISPGQYQNGANFVVTSQFAPQIQYTSVINVACNLVNQGDVNANPNVFYQFVPNAPFGELIAEIPPYPVFVPVGDAVYQYIQISLLDDNFNPLQLRDPTVYGFVIVQG